MKFQKDPTAIDRTVLIQADGPEELQVVYYPNENTISYYCKECHNFVFFQASDPADALVTAEKEFNWLCEYCDKRVLRKGEKKLV